MKIVWIEVQFEIAFSHIYLFLLVRFLYFAYAVPINAFHRDFVCTFFLEMAKKLAPMWIL